MRIEVDSAGWNSAVDEFESANRGVVDALTAVSSTLGGSGSMAGTDSGGQEWARQYDEAAGPLLQAGSQMGEVLGRLAQISAASLANHQRADDGSRLSGPSGAADVDATSSGSVESVSVATLPSAFGGTGDQPGWWHWISGHIGGLLWPDADTGRLRDAGSAWSAAGRSITAQGPVVAAASAQIQTQRSPEVAGATATCAEVQGHLEDLGAAYVAIGGACSDYAQQVDEHHKMIEDELKSFVEWTIGIEAGGALLGALTLGIGEAAAQAAEAAKVAEAAAKVVSILERLLELARLAALRIGEVVSKIAGILERLKAIMNAKVLAAAEKVVPAAAERAAIAAPEEGMTVWRVGGEAQDGIGGLQRGSLPFGESWTPKDPRLSEDFRWDAGLPDENPGRFVFEGVLRDPGAVSEVRPALPLDGNPGGWPEYLIKDADKAVDLQRVSGVNEPWTRQPGDWAP